MASTSGVSITFCGAAETVTGSRFLVDCHGRRVLVDCGLFQGIKRLRRLNWDPFPLPPETIDAVVLTHAHIDHSGYLPRLVREGFHGTVWCTDGTEALSRILLLDSAHLHEEDARYANRHGTSRHHPALPLYTTEDAERALLHLRSVGFGTPFEPVPGVTASFSPVGHIVGAAAVHLATESTSLAFTGDVGRPNDPVMREPAQLPPADFVVTESTYGNRLHPRVDTRDELAEVVSGTLGRGGTLLIPVFAVGRAQSILHLLAELRHSGRIPEVPTYLNSPMAIDATELFVRFSDQHRLDDAACRAMCQGVEFVRTPEASKEITALRGPMIVLAASGMLSGGRVLHHLKAVAPNPRNTILMTGFQAAGTRGEALLNGARTVKVYGGFVPVNAEIVRLDSLSAHADADELIAWLGGVPRPRDGAAVVHGEQSAADTFRRRLRDELGWRAGVPAHGERVELPAPAVAS